MKFFERILTIIVTATLTSALWIVFGSAFFAAAERDSAGEAAPAAMASGGPDAPSAAALAAATPPETLPATPPAAPAPAPASPPVEAALAIPVAGVVAGDLTDSFLDPRGENDLRRHEAIDIMAPRGTRVIAATAGVVAKLHRSKAGGRTIYVRSSDGRYLYLYAHLDAYADGLKEGDRVARGDALGAVGSSGNASADAPHLHFAVLETTADAEWWEPANAVNPYPLLTEPREVDPDR